MKFKHMPEVMNCQFCHSQDHVNQLNLMNGTLVDYDEMYKVCAQCHGKIAYEWELNLHGKISGGWTGDRVRWVCGQCHDPHAPKFPSMGSVANPPVSSSVIPKEKE